MNVLQTERLALRRLTTEDAEFILQLLNEPSFLRFIGDKGVRTLEEAQEYILTGPMTSYEKHGFGLFLTTLRESGVPVGICGLLKRDTLQDVDVGYAFLPQFWSRGFAFESASAVIAYGKSAFALTRVVAITDPTNHGSIKVLEKLGLKFEQMIRLTPDSAEIQLFGRDI